MIQITFQLLGHHRATKRKPIGGMGGALAGIVELKRSQGSSLATERNKPEGTNRNGTNRNGKQSTLGNLAKPEPLKKKEKNFVFY